MALESPAVAASRNQPQDAGLIREGCEAYALERILGEDKIHIIALCKAMLSES